MVADAHYAGADGAPTRRELVGRGLPDGVSLTSRLRRNAVLKATNVDGVYDADPKQNPSAKRYDRLTPREALERNLKVMDSTAFALARENGMPIIVFSIREPGAVEAVLRGKGRATIVAG